MRILAVETATPRAGVALLDGETVVAEAGAEVPQGHLEWLAPAIAGLLDAARWRPQEVEGVAVSVGPGTFTGLRIGIATAAAWAYARRIPVAGVSTLEALAEGAAEEAGAGGIVCPVLDARRGEVAGALFEIRPPALRLLEDAVGPASVLLARLTAGISVVFVGDGVPRVREAIAGRPGWREGPETLWYPRAAVTGRIGLRRMRRGDSDEPYRLRPVYVRSAGVTPSPWTAPGQTGGGNPPARGGRGQT